jgi:hypothetical protein
MGVFTRGDSKGESSMVMVLTSMISASTQEAGRTVKKKGKVYRSSNKELSTRGST